jgi:hypothetical protein
MHNPRLHLMCAAWLILASSLAAATTNEITHPYQGVRLIHSKSTVPREVDIWIAEIDMAAPGIAFFVTPSNGELVGDTTPQTVREFVTKAGAQFGINGSFFSMTSKESDALRQSNVTGLSVSKGDAYSPFARGFEEAINISKENVATIVYGTGEGGRIAPAKRDPRQARIAPPPGRAKSSTAEGSKAASSKSTAKQKVIKPSSHVPGTVPNETKEKNIGLVHQPAVPLYNALSGKTHLVESGENVANDDSELHPRTAVGIKADGKLLLVTVDGREPGRSMGMTLGELGDLLIQWGARDAISLDGGGSTTFVMDDPATPENDPKVMNLPSDKFPDGKQGKERAVANSLAVFARKAPPPVKNEVARSDAKPFSSPQRFCGCCRSTQRNWVADPTIRRRACW